MKKLLLPILFLLAMSVGATCPTSGQVSSIRPPLGWWIKFGTVPQNDSLAVHFEGKNIFDPIWRGIGADIEMQGDSVFVGIADFDQSTASSTFTWKLVAKFYRWTGVMVNCDSLGNNCTAKLWIPTGCQTDTFIMNDPILPALCFPTAEFAYTDTILHNVNFSALPVWGVNNYNWVGSINGGGTSTVPLVISPGQTGLEFTLPITYGATYTWRFDAVDGAAICTGNENIYQDTTTDPGSVTQQNVLISNGVLTGTATSTHGNGGGNHNTNGGNSHGGNGRH